MTIDHAKLFRLERDLDQQHDMRHGMSKTLRETHLTIQQIKTNPRPADPAKDAVRIGVLQREAADLGERLAMSGRDVHALEQLVTACRRYVDEEAAAAAATTEEQQ